MNQNLLKCYEVIPNFISSTDAKKLAEEFKVNDNYFKFKGDVQAPNSAPHIIIFLHWNYWLIKYRK